MSNMSDYLTDPDQWYIDDPPKMTFSEVTQVTDCYCFSAPVKGCPTHDPGSGPSAAERNVPVAKTDLEKWFMDDPVDFIDFPPGGPPSKMGDLFPFGQGMSDIKRALAKSFEGIEEKQAMEGHRFREGPEGWCTLCFEAREIWLHTIEAIEEAMPEFGTVPPVVEEEKS